MGTPWTAALIMSDFWFLYFVQPHHIMADGYSVTARHLNTCVRGGITCGAIDEPRKSSKAIDKRVIIDFGDKNVITARFCDQNKVFI